MKLAWFAGADWGSRKHQACVLDPAGKVLGEREFEHGGAGLWQMADWLLSFGAGEVGEIGVAIEMPRGPVVESLMERGFAVHSLNPKAARPFPGPHLAGGREGRPARRAGTRLGAAYRPALVCDGWNVSGPRIPFHVAATNAYRERAAPPFFLVIRPPARVRFQTKEANAMVDPSRSCSTVESTAGPAEDQAASAHCATAPSDADPAAGPVHQGLLARPRDAGAVNRAAGFGPQAPFRAADLDDRVGRAVPGAQLPTVPASRIATSHRARRRGLRIRRMSHALS